LDFDRLRSATVHRGSDQMFQYLVNHAKETKVIDEAVDVDYLYRIFNILDHNLRALRNYKPRVSELPVHLFIAGLAELSPVTGWNGLCTIKSVTTIPGDHYSIMGEPNVVSLARVIDRVLV